MRASRRGIEEDWYTYRNGKLDRIAIAWLKATGIPFIDNDTATPGPSADKR